MCVLLAALIVKLTLVSHDFEEIEGNIYDYGRSS